MSRRDQFSQPPSHRDERHNVQGAAPNYGNARERVVRTSHGGDAAFQGRDFERENYGGGYGVQRKTRDVPAAGRKGEWMQGGRREEHRYRGQAGGSGMDGLASERAFGSGPHEQMSKISTDSAYQRWREAELQGHDEDYRAWRRAQALRLDEDYARWKSRGGR